MKKESFAVETEAGKATTRRAALMRVGSTSSVALTVIVGGYALGLAGDSMPVPIWVWVAMVFAALLAGVLGCLEIYVGITGARAEEKRLRQRILAQIFAATALPKNAEAEFDSPRLVQMMTDNVERMTEFRQQYWGSTKAALITPFLVLTYILLAIDWRLGLGMAIGFPFVPLLVGGFLHIFRRVSAASRNERALLTSQYLDALRNLTAVRLFGAGPRLEKALKKQGEKNRVAIMRLLAGNQIVIIVLDGVFSLFLIVWSVFLTTKGIDAGHLSATDAVTTMFLLVLLLEPLTQVAGFFYVGMGGMAAQRAIREYLASHAEQESLEHVSHGARGIDGKHQTPSIINTGREVVAIGSSDTAILVKDLCYDYGRGEVLHNVNLAVPRGTKTAIIGPSGSGKTTLLSVLRGSLPLQAGTVVIDGHDLRDLPVGEIRALAATVSQSTWLFNGTVADNLRIANQDATTDQMWEALEAAKLADDVRAMPLQLDSPVGEQGAFLSGGQAQRLSIARALLSGRKILFFDEPTSQVDLESEARIIDAIAGIGDEVAILLITHRHSLLTVADTVLEMADGQLQQVVG
ncbi:MAG: ABC transporter ATP-binding protein [Actinomycetaceae bacterium]|nr:ABC transporter ATP-binding protein [Actinomycetaceae bacterium]